MRAMRTTDATTSAGPLAMLRAEMEALAAVLPGMGSGTAFGAWSGQVQGDWRGVPADAVTDAAADASVEAQFDNLPV